MNERENAGEREKERADKTEIDGMTEMKKEEGNVRDRQTDRQTDRDTERDRDSISSSQDIIGLTG